MNSHVGHVKHHAVASQLVSAAAAYLEVLLLGLRLLMWKPLNCNVFTPVVTATFPVLNNDWEPDDCMHVSIAAVVCCNVYRLVSYPCTLLFLK